MKQAVLLGAAFCSNIVIAGGYIPAGTDVDVNGRNFLFKILI